MTKKGLRRIQLVLLAVVAGLIIWRMGSRPAGEGFITLSDPGMRALESGHFEVLAPVVVHLAGEVSFEDDKAGSELAVLAWILDRDSGEPVWQTTPDGVKREGVRAIVEDSVRLEPGAYSAYLSTYGPDDDSHRQGSPFGLKPFWTNYEGYWKLDLRAPEGSVRVLDRPRSSSSRDRHLATISLTDRSEEKSIMVHADGASALRVAGGITRCNARCDKASVRRVPSGQVVWGLEQSDAVAAGGSRVNHWLDTEVLLPDGVYEFVLEPGAHRGGWSENPPWRPDDFELHLDAGGQGEVSVVETWDGGRPLVDLTRQGDDVMVASRIATQDSLLVIVYAMGELRSDSNRYDWGWVERSDSNAIVWEMTWDNSAPAGGDSDNREAMAILSLGPGEYVASYRSDGSHSFADFNRSRPTHPERWGMAIFALDPAVINPDRVQVQRVERAPEAPMSKEVVAPMGSALSDIAEERFLVNLTRLGHDEDTSASFTLTDTTQVIIQALGEISNSSAFDYGWLENPGNGERIWEMTRENTRPGGGSGSFRVARTELTLAPGTYRAHFRTDGSVSYEDFGSDVPDNPEDWGIAIFRAQ